MADGAVTSSKPVLLPVTGSSTGSTGPVTRRSTGPVIGAIVPATGATRPATRLATGASVRVRGARACETGASTRRTGVSTRDVNSPNGRPTSPSTPADIGALVLAAGRVTSATTPLTEEAGVDAPPTGRPADPVTSRTAVPRPPSTPRPSRHPTLHSGPGTARIQASAPPYGAVQPKQCPTSCCQLNRWPPHGERTTRARCSPNRGVGRGGG